MLGIFLLSQELDLDILEEEEILPETAAPAPSVEKSPEQRGLKKVKAMANKVQVVKDENGWKLLVDGKPFFVKGVVWSYTPIGENYSYNLWEKPEDFIKRMIDYDAQLMKEMGVNAIRVFGTIPPKWVTYLYKNYGIYTIINDLAGRYGVMVDGKWIYPTNYSDPKVRQTIVENALAVVRAYKDVPGVLMFIFGNENNYGLEWKSFEIENLPVGERQRARAKYLYTLFEEILSKAKQIDPNHPMGIANGDLQYIDLIAKYCKSLDIMGANVYRGKSATDLFATVKEKLDKPFMFTEFGCDAFNAKTGEEDQYHQALYFKEQWREIYLKSYGKGQEANCIGGTVFEWLDEWWKTGQITDLDVHNTDATWSNGGYKFDFEPGKNNMNEEWWGICAQSVEKVNGINKRIPRAGYYVLQQIWKLDPYDLKAEEIKTFFDALDITPYVMMGEVGSIKERTSGLERIKVEGGQIRAELVCSTDDTIIGKGKNGGFLLSDGEMVFLRFGFKPLSNLKGELSVNVLGNVPQKRLESFYGMRGEPFDVLVDEGGYKLEADDTKTIYDNERVEIYNFSFEYENKYVDIKGFYHIPRYHWGYEGDFFRLLQEATDMRTLDIYNAKAPSGIEISAKGALEGLKILAGPEVYWGANPKIMVKYYKDFGSFAFGLIHSEDISQRTATTAVTGALPPTRKSSLYLRLGFLPVINNLEFGLLFASPEKVGRTFIRAVKSSGSGYLGSGWDIIQNDTIKFIDTLAVKAKMDLDFGIGSLYTKFILAGLVADGGVIPGSNGSLITDPGTGNRIEVEGGLRFFLGGSFQIAPKFLYREPLVGPNPLIEGYVTSDGKIYPGVRPRNPIDDPFAVYGNRKALIGEVSVVYDPTGGSWFYYWDNDDREDAPVAFGLTFNYADYPTSTDATTYVTEDGQTVAFTKGLPPAKVWALNGRVVINPASFLRIIARIEAGRGQSTGQDERLVNYTALYLNSKFHNLLFYSYVKKDMWGPYDYHRQFNLTYPWQWMLDVSYGFETPFFLKSASRIGIHYVHKILDEYSPENQGDVTYKYIFETSLYYIVNF